MRILAVGRYYPPSAFSEALCAGRFVWALAEAGAEVTFLTVAGNEPANEEDGSLFEHPAVRVVRVPGSPREQPRRALAYLGSWWAAGATPDGSFFAEAVRRAAEGLQGEGRFDLVYGRALPASGLYGACQVAEITGLPWVQHLNAPWPASLYPEPYRSTTPCLTRCVGVMGRRTP